MKKCLREKCTVYFEPNKPKQVFCSDKCRVYYSRENKKIKLLDATNPTNQMEPAKQPKTNFTINTTKNQGMTLERLKSLCPTNLTGIDRSAWIAQERVKYGI